MTSYDTNQQYHQQQERSTPAQTYSSDQYDGTSSSSASSSPNSHILMNSAQKANQVPDDYASTDSSNNEDSNLSLTHHINYFNGNLNDPAKYNNFNNLLNYGYPFNQYFNPNDSLLNNIANESIFQSSSIANFDPNFVALRPKASEANDKPKAKLIKPKGENIEMRNPSYLIQPPDSASIEAATASAKKNRPKRRSRTKFEKDQLDMLELTFERTHYPDVNVVDRLSRVLNLSTEKISIWFQNRRARFKRTKKDPKKEATNLNHNPILEEHGIFDNDDNESIKSFRRVLSSNRLNDEDRGETTANSFNENDSDNEEGVKNEQIKEINKPVKPIFNPISLPSSISNQNLQRAFPIYPQQIIKQEQYPIQNVCYNNQFVNLKLTTGSNLEQSEENSNSNSDSTSSSISSRNSSPKLDSGSSSPDLKQNENQNYYQHINENNQHVNQVQGNFLGMTGYQTSFNNNLYMPHMQPYAPNFPTLFQPYIDYTKPELSNNAYFYSSNPHPVSGLSTYYNNVQI